MEDANVVDAKAAASITISRVRCGYCGGEMPEQWQMREGWCPCGGRRISSLGSGQVLVHKEGCTGGNCNCGNVFN